MPNCPSKREDLGWFCDIPDNQNLWCCSRIVNVNSTGERVRTPLGGASTGGAKGGGVSMPTPDEVFATWPDLFLRRIGPDQWERLTSEEVTQLNNEFMQEFGEDRPITTERLQQLARFYNTRNLSLLQADALAAVWNISQGKADPELTLEYADTLRRSGFHEVAVTAYRSIITYLPEDTLHARWAGLAWQGQARSLDALGREDEADLAAAATRQIFSLVDPDSLAGQLRTR